MKAAVSNRECGEKVLKVLLDRHRSDIRITEDVVKTAARNPRCGQQVITLLLDRCHDVFITEEMIRSANKNTRVQTLLLNGCSSPKLFKENVLKAAAGDNGSRLRVARMLYRDNAIVITEELLKAAEKDQKVKALFLETSSGTRIETFKEHVLKASARDTWSRWRIKIMLARYTDLVISEELLKAAEGDEEVKALLLAPATYAMPGMTDSSDEGGSEPDEDDSELDGGDSELNQGDPQLHEGGSEHDEGGRELNEGHSELEGGSKINERDAELDL